MMSDEASERLTRLESHVAHLEHQVEELNGVVIKQGKLIKREDARADTCLFTRQVKGNQRGRGVHRP